MSWRRTPRKLGFAVAQMRDELAPQTLLGDIQSCWLRAVGPAIAAEASPTAERGGVLTVACSASVWAHELDLMAPAILDRLNAHLHDRRITRLRCVAVPAREPS